MTTRIGKGPRKNKANFPAGPGGSESREVRAVACCTNKANFRQYADREIGGPRGQSCETKPIGRGSGRRHGCGIRRRVPAAPVTPA